MNTNISTYKLIDEEIEYYLENWEFNTNKTQAQRDAYPYSKINKDMLGNAVTKNGKDSIRLLEEDGWDGEYVGSVAPRTARNYGLDNESRTRFRSRDLIRLGLFFHMDFHQILLLVLKKDWEIFLYKRLKEDRLDNGLNEMALLKSTKDMYKYIIEFADEDNKDNDKLYKLFRIHNNLAQNNGYDRMMLTFLINAMLTNKLPLYALDSKEVEDFQIKWLEEQQLMSSSERKTKGEYIDLKQEWMTLRNSIGQSLLRQEKIRDRNYATRVEWAKNFGDHEIEIHSLNSEKERLNAIKKNKKGNPDFDFNKIEELAENDIITTRKQMEDEKKKIEDMISFARMIEQKDVLASLFSGNASDSKMWEYKSEMEEMQRKILREVYFATYPDITKRKKFTKEQVEELTDLFKEHVNIKKFKGITIEERIPLYKGLLDRANKIWDSMGLAYDDDIDPTSNSPEELIEKLKAGIQGLEEKESQIRNDIYVLLNDVEIRDKEITLTSPKAIEKTIESFLEDIDNLEKEIEELKKEVNKLFNKTVVK